MISMSNFKQELNSFHNKVIYIYMITDINVKLPVKYMITDDINVKLPVKIYDYE